MALSEGSREGSYEILSAIGAGGMGEVYRAIDICIFLRDDEKNGWFSVRSPDFCNDEQSRLPQRDTEQK